MAYPEGGSEQVGAMSCWSVYMVRCADGSLYTGVSTDVTRRLREHAGAGGRGARYLRGRGPLELVYCQSVGTRGMALRLEYRIKQLRREQKQSLIAGAWCALSLLEASVSQQ